MTSKQKSPRFTIAVLPQRAFSSGSAINPAIKKPVRTKKGDLISGYIKRALEGL